MVGDTPIYDIIVGNDEGQIPLRKLNSYLMKLPRNITSAQVGDLDNRLTALGNQVPAGRPAQGSAAGRREDRATCSAPPGAPADPVSLRPPGSHISSLIMTHGFDTSACRRRVSQLTCHDQRCGS